MGGDADVLLQEWKNALRSSIQPLLLAVIYRAIATLSDALFTPVLKTLFLVLLPKTVMALFAALQDYYTWNLAERIYGRQSKETTAIVCKLAIDRSEDKNERLITRLSVVRHHVAESVAVVCVDPRPVEFSRDHSYGNCTVLLALGVVETCGDPCSPEPRYEEVSA